MSKFKLILIAFIAAFVNLLQVEAASFNLSASTHQVSPNGTFTVKVGGDCIGRVDIKATNGKLSTSSVWVEQGYVTVTVTAGSEGAVTVTATPVTGFSDSDANIYSPGSRSVAVVVTTPSTPGTNTTKKPNSSSTTSKKSSDNDLSNLTIDSGTLSPSFDSSKTQYTVNLPKETKELTINATAKHPKAKISGIGKINLKPGNNRIDITVTAENGSKKTYQITAYVDETPDVYLDYKGETIGIVKNLDNLEVPEGFQKEEYNINEKNVTIFAQNKIAIIYGVNGAERSFYLFDKETGLIRNRFSPIKIKDNVLYIVDKEPPYDFLYTGKTSLQDNEFECYQFDSSENDYCLLNTIDAEKNYREYLYEKSEGTIQLFPKFLMTYGKNAQKKDNLITYILSTLLVISIVTIIVLILKNKKRKCDEKN